MSDGSPDVIIDFVFDQGLLYIAVVNIGTAPACRVSVTFEPEIMGLGGTKKSSDMPLFRRIEFMPPGKRIETFLDTSASYFAHKQPLETAVVVKFADREGREYSSAIKHNLDIYRDIGYVERGRDAVKGTR